MSEPRKSDQEIEREKKRQILIENHQRTYNKAVKGAVSIRRFKNLKKGGILFGRVMAKRDMGKSHFIDLLDETGEIQLYINTRKLDEESLKNLNLLDIGDFCGAAGSYMLTKTKEETQRVEKFWIVTKALIPLPNKFTKLKSEEEQIRKRYLYLLLNEDKRKIFEMRTAGNNAVRKYFNKAGFKEVQTPHLHTLSTGALAKPFLTYHNALDMDMYLRIAPELDLKRLIAGNMGKVFEIARCYRNEGISNKHNPEFDLVEAYIPNGTVKDVMKITEGLIRKVAIILWGSCTGIIKGRKYDLKNKFKQYTMNGIIKEMFKIDILNVSLKKAKEFSKKNNVNLDSLKIVSNGTIMQKIFDDLVESTLLDPTFIFEPPVEMSPLAKANDKDKRVANRFELFIHGMEIANGYDEQNDPFDQEAIFKKQLEQKKMGDEEAGDFDTEYITMLKHGLPPTGGLGVGLDRLYMLFLDLDSIKEIILFPPVRKKGLS